MTNPDASSPLSLGDKHNKSHYDAFDQASVQTEYAGQGPVIFVDPQYGRDQSDTGFVSRTAGSRDDPFKSIGTRAGASTDGAIPFGVTNGTGADSAGQFTVMVRTGPRSDVTPVTAGPPPTFTDGTIKARTLTISEQINPPHGVWIGAEGMPSDGALTTMNAGVRVVPSASFPASTALFKIQKSSRIFGIAAVNTATGGVGFEISGNNSALVNCVAFQCQKQGVIAQDNGNDNASIRGGFYRENDQSDSGVAAIELFDSVDHSTPYDYSKEDAPNHMTIGPFVDFGGNLNGAIRCHSAANATAPGGAGIFIYRNRIHGNTGGDPNGCPLVTMKGLNGFHIEGNYFENAGNWDDAFVVIDAANITTETVTAVALQAGTSYTYTFGTVGNVTHPFHNQDVVTVAGFTPAGYNGTYTVSNATAETIRLDIGTNPAVVSVFGTVATSPANERYWPHAWTVEKNYFHGADAAVLPAGKAQWVNVLYGAGGRIRDNWSTVTTAKVSADRPLYRFSANTRANYGDFQSAYATTWAPLIVGQVVQDAGSNNYGVWHNGTADALWGTWPV